MSLHASPTTTIITEKGNYSLRTHTFELANSWEKVATYKRKEEIKEGKSYTKQS